MVFSMKFLTGFSCQGIRLLTHQPLRILFIPLIMMAISWFKIQMELLQSPLITKKMNLLFSRIQNLIYHLCQIRVCTLHKLELYCYISVIELTFTLDFDYCICCFVQTKIVSFLSQMNNLDLELFLLVLPMPL